MSNITDFMDCMICVLNNPKEKTMWGVVHRFKEEDGIDKFLDKTTKHWDLQATQELTKEEKALKKKEYYRNYMKEYLKTYVQPEHKTKSHNSNRRRKYGTALITSKKRRKEAETKGLTIDKNGYIIQPKGVKDES